MQVRAGLLAALAIVAMAVPGVPARAEGWQAGTGRVAITPKGPIWMAGYGARTRPSEGVMHDLWAKALLVRDPAGTPALLVTLDVCGIGRPLSNAIRDAIHAKHGLERSQIVLACSHTHSGPVLRENLIGMYPIDDVQMKVLDDYVVSFKEAVAGAVEQAFASLAPAELSWETGRCDFAVNRRTNEQLKAADLRSRIALQGPVDHDVPVLKVAAAGGALKAVVALYACHCTVLSGYELSGDYAGFAQIALEKAHPGAQAMFVAGCGGDQNPLPRGTRDHAEKYGQQLADAVERVLSGPARPVAGAMKQAYTEIPLAFGTIPDRAFWEEETRSKALANANRAKQLLARIDAEGSLPATYPYPVQVWRLGDLSWYFLGGEVTVDYSLRLKRNLGSSHTWVAAYSNDVMAYIPSLRVLKEGGYEGGGAMVYYGLPAPWSERVEEQIVDAVHQLDAATAP